MRRITHRDLRSLGLCNRGLRPWMERHGIPWARFIRDGITIKDAEAMHDGQVDHYLKELRRRGLK